MWRIAVCIRLLIVELVAASRVVSVHFTSDYAATRAAMDTRAGIFFFSLKDDLMTNRCEKLVHGCLSYLGRFILMARAWQLLLIAGQRVESKLPGVLCM